MTNSERDEGFGCDDCRYYSNRRCRLWEIRISEPHDSYCVSGRSSSEKHYRQRCTELITAACRAEELYELDELEAYAMELRQKKEQETGGC